MRYAKMAGIATICLALGTTAAFSGNGNGKANGQAKFDRHNGAVAVAGCPPGLAKKNPPCVPPGQAGKQYGPGDRITGDYVLIRDPYRYGLDNGTYFRVGDYVYRVNRETREVLDFIGAAAALLN